jgi:hypothetical protein
MQEDYYSFPRMYYAVEALDGRLFATPEALEDAGGPGVWFRTPTDALHSQAETVTIDVPPALEET